jgi:DNA-binding MarR family transcriptional regulator
MGATTRSDDQLTPDRAREIGRACSHFALRRATRAITRLYDDMLRPTGLRATQFTVLAVVRASEPATQSEIARIAQLDATTLTRAIRPLERKGLVRVAAGRSDRRHRVVSSTAKGRRLLHAASQYWDRAQAELAKRMGDDEMQELVAMLHRTARATKRRRGSTR